MIRKYDVLTVTVAENVVYTIPIKDVTAEKADDWLGRLVPRTGSALRVVVERAGTYLPGEVWNPREDSEE